MKRGRYNRPFLHFTTMGVLGFGVLIGPYIADTYPIFSNTAALQSQAQAQKQSITIGDNVFQTQVSAKPREKIIIYSVEKGDTITTIAKKFGISENTVRWENDLTGDDLSIGQELKILPVPGVAHKVVSGDTVYTIAKKYDTDAQKIVDFPFNEFVNPETFALVEGQMLIVPDGIQPSVPQSQRENIRREAYIASAPVTSVSGGGFAFPLPGNTGISQYASWYHMALDITAAYGTPVYAAQNGTVSRVSLGAWDGGYGNNVTIDNGAGYQTHYAHMTGSNVSVGQQTVAGKTIVGWVGMTGRTTGPHLHFELFQNGVLVNPLPFVQ